MTDKMKELTNSLRAAYPRIAQVLPPRAASQWTPERVAAMAAMAAYRQPKLLDCDRASVIAAVIEAASLGLEPGGPLAEAALIPRRSKSGKVYCQLMPTYRGLLLLAYRSGGLKSAFAHVVRSRDHFELQYGVEPRIVHVPRLDGERGDPIGAYAVAELMTGGRDFEYMTRAEIEAIRRRSSADESGPWTTDWDEMARKTVLRRLIKRLPLSGDLLSRAIQADNWLYGEQRVPPPSTPQVEFERALVAPEVEAEPPREPQLQIEEEAT